MQTHTRKGSANTHQERQCKIDDKCSLTSGSSRPRFQSLHSAAGSNPARRRHLLRSPRDPASTYCAWACWCELVQKAGFGFRGTHTGTVDQSDHARGLRPERAVRVLQQCLHVPRNSKSARQLIQNTQAIILTVANVF